MSRRHLAFRHVQDGSAATLLLLALVILFAWWQWDWISGFVGAGGSGGALELVDYRCDRGSFDGRVKNGSQEPISVRAVTVILDSSGQKSDYREAGARPSPIPPGQEATFRGETGPVPDGGSCRLDHFVDADSGRKVRHSGDRH
jgi:hypothetical protein